MKNKRLIMTLATPLLVAAPLVSVISCGVDKKAKDIISNARGGSSKGDEHGAVGGNSQNNGNGASAVNYAQASVASNVTISAPVAQALTPADVDSTLFAKIENPTAFGQTKFDVYTVTLPGTTHQIKFAFDQAVHYTNADAQLIIKTWAATANYGYGILNFDKVIITNQKMGSAGWGGAFKDILVASNDLNGLDANMRGKEMQVTFNTLLHEYGHHETSALIDGNGEKQTQALLADNVIGTTMFKNTAADANAEKARLTSVVGSNNLEHYYQQFFGAQVGAAYSLNPNFVFDMSYHMGTHMEFLNRVMNIIELQPLDVNNLGGFYGFPDLLKYQMGETEKMLNDDGTYTAAAHKLVTAYAKDVYGYEGFGVQADGWDVKGFSDLDFDLIKATDMNGKENVAPVEKIESHYISRDKLFETAKVVNHSYAIHATIVPKTQGAVPTKSVTFWKDTNKNGQIDAGDTEVTVPVKIATQP